MCTNILCWRKKEAMPSSGFPIIPNTQEQASDCVENQLLEYTRIYSSLCQHSYGDVVDAINRRRDEDLEIMNTYRTMVNGRYLLHMCVKEGSVGVERVIEACLQAGADIECRDFQGHTPLTLACLLGKATIVECLLAHNANSNATTTSGETALHMICYSHQNQVSIVDSLVAHGADVEVVDRDGNCVLHLCAWLNQNELLLHFVKKGCNINACNKQWKTPLMLVASCSNSRSLVVSTLLDLEATVDDTDCTGMTAFLWAANRYPNAGDDILMQLAKKGADIYATSNDGRSGRDILLEKHMTPKTYDTIEDAWNRAEKPMSYVLK